MQIEVKGASPKLKAELEEAARFFGKILLHGKTYKNIVLDIEVHKKYDSLGDCVDEEDNSRPRFFTINLLKTKKSNAEQNTDIIQTLAHEMVHLKQHATGELRSGITVPTKGGFSVKSKWHGQLWTPGTKDHAYYDSPWEIEAYGREVGLYYRWVQHKYY